MQKLISNTLSQVVLDKNLDDSIKELDKKVFIIDKNVYKLCKEKLDLLKHDSHFYIFEAKENNKTLSEVEKIYAFFIKNIVTRNTVIVGIGGGITTDIAAFAASTFKRGCRLQLVPTTFLGMIDAAIGGKTAVNYNGIKNNIGTFYPAEKVIINTQFLDTLPEKEMLNGWVECIKLSLISKTELSKLLHNKNELHIEKIIKAAIQIKLSICKKDINDKNERKLLNLGHTFGHVLESISGYQISHGEAVVVGIRVAAYISNKLGYLNKNDLEKINDLLNLYDLPIRVSASYINKLKKYGLDILLKDKKATSKLNVVLFARFQKTFIKQVDKPKEILELFIQFLSKVN